MGSYCVALILFLALTLPLQHKEAVTRTGTVDAAVACDRQRALDLVAAEVYEAKYLDNPADRIRVLIRAAGLLWTHQQDTARSIFSRAYELAEERFKEKGDESRKEGGLSVALEDQRAVVTRAIAQRDTAWARQLAARMAEDTRQEAERKEREGKSAAGDGEARATELNTTADKLLNLATSLVAIDSQAALAVAKTSFRLPASFALGRFLYVLAATKLDDADRLYENALKAYGPARINDLLMLSAYPFGAARVFGRDSLSSYFRTPNGFVPSPRIQQLFLQVLLQRAEMKVNVSPEPVSGHDPEASQLYLGLAALEPLIASEQPVYLERASMLKARIGATLSADERREVFAILQRQQRADDNSYERLVEQADQESNSDRRESYLALAVLQAPNSESTSKLVEIAERIRDLSLRHQLLDWLYFKRCETAVKLGDLDGAKLLASNVEQLDHRAYLMYEIASEALKRPEDGPRASEILNEVAAAAYKAANTTEKARTLIGSVHLYLRFDRARGLEMAAEAVRTINRISEPDLTSTTMFQRVEGKTFSQYAAYQVEAFSLESLFRELSQAEFSTALSLARSFEDRSLRSIAVIAVSGPCLENSEKPSKSPPSKRRKQSQ